MRGSWICLCRKDLEVGCSGAIVRFALARRPKAKEGELAYRVSGSLGLVRTWRDIESNVHRWRVRFRCTVVHGWRDEPTVANQWA